jgi:site-specific recombinase
MSRLLFVSGKNRKKNIRSILEVNLKGEEQDEKAIELLGDLVDHFRPSNPEAVRVVSIKELIVLIEQDQNLLASLKSLLYKTVKGKRFTRILTDTGILKDNRFFGEVKGRIFSKFLPKQPDKDSLEYILNQLFYKSSDIIWIKKIPNSEIQHVVALLQLDTVYANINENSPLSEVLNALNIIIQRISGKALEEDILDMVPEFEDLQSPFEGFEQELNQIENQLRKSEMNWLEPEDPGYRQLNILLKQCYNFVDKAYENSAVYGISMSVNQSLLRIRQQLDRISTLIPLLKSDSEEDRRINSMQLGLQLIEYNCYKNNISQLIDESTAVIAYEITKHSAKTGEHYITSDRKEYYNMLKASLGGGVIVGFLCVFKLLLSKVEASDFGYAFLYSMNYSLGFIAIYLLGFTLATKQPAMTAAAIVDAIDKGIQTKHEELFRHAAFAELFSRLFRSQFIAFVGNVVAAFPIALAGIWIIDLSLDYNIGQTKWPKLQNDLSPIHSKLILHAAIAGVFLFLSGVISGSISNKLKYNKIPYRINEHPLLRSMVGREKTTRLSNWVASKWPGVASNFWFGIFMGTTASVGAFIGLDLDIRHITFGSGNLGLSLYGSEFRMSGEMVFWAIIGIALIGFINFIVSFLLSLGLAMRSRNLKFKELKDLFSSVWLYFKVDPQSFFFPRKQ